MSRKGFLAALLKGLQTEIDKLLTANPDLLKDANNKDRTVFYAVAGKGKFASIEQVFKHNAYQALALQEKHTILREIVRGGIQYVLKHSRGPEFNEPIQALEKIIQLNKKILDKDDDDYSLYLYALYLLAGFYALTNDRPNAIKILKDVLFIADKIVDKTNEDLCNIISCLNLLAKHYAAQQQFQDAIDCFHEATQFSKFLSHEGKRKPRIQ
jgi:tetratricopeptide (TPR) repeat protein